MSLKCYYCYELAWDENDIKYYEEYSKVNKEDPTPVELILVTQSSLSQLTLVAYSVGEVSVGGGGEELSGVLLFSTLLA
jgi:hypothetical protein